MPAVPRPSDPVRLQRALGGLSAALAAAPLAVPGAFGAALGVGAGPRQRLAARVVGARELVAAAALLAKPAPAWVWMRVGGDAMDLALLGRALLLHDGRGLRRTVTAATAVGAITALDVWAAIVSSNKETGMHLTATTTINKQPDEVYSFWHRLENLSTFMAHVDDVRTTGEGTSHWSVSAPFGRTVEWDATTTEDTPGRRIAWKSVEGADVDNAGSVEFRTAPGNRGTEVHVSIDYSVPGGKLGEALAKYFGEDPHQQLDDDLRRLKQVLETGEVVRSDGAPGGKRARKEFPQHPAQPLTDDELATEVKA